MMDDFGKEVIGKEQAMRKMYALLAVSGLLIAMLAAPAGAKSDARPFKAFMTGEMFWDDTAFECLDVTGIPVRSNMDATGRVSHLGRSTLTGDHCTPEDIYYPDPSESSVATLVAANGDKVYLEYHGECPPLDTVPIPGVLTCSFEFDVDGGTGRFDGATGEGIGTLSMIWLGKVERADAWWTWTGTIGY